MRYFHVFNGLAAAFIVAVGSQMAYAQPSESDSPSPESASFDPVSTAVTVDWGAELVKGGITMVALSVLSIAMVMFVVERTIRLRTSRVVAPKLVKRVIEMIRTRRYDEARTVCRKDGSIFAEVAEFLIAHRHVDPQLTMAGAGDLAARAIDSERDRTYPLAVIASLAPLLGLLGTMIGMIEAFRLVEVFGDEGGASLLAGSISKALITTAVGLILAIPALVAYHFFRHRVNRLADKLEHEADAVFRVCYYRPMSSGGSSGGSSSGSSSGSSAGRSRSSSGARSESARAAKSLQQAKAMTHASKTTPAK